MPSRILRDFRDSATMARLTDFQERLFVRMIQAADDFGRGLASNLHASCFQVSDVPREKVGFAALSLQDAGLIRLYADNQGRAFFEIIKFGNKPRATHSRWPSYEECKQLAGNLQAICMQTDGDLPALCSSKPETINRKPETGNTPQTPPEPSPEIPAPVRVSRKPKRTKQDEEDVSRLYAIIPKKEAYEAAVNQYAKTKNKPPIEELERILKAQVAEKGEDWTKERARYCIRLSVWLKEFRWKDELCTPLSLTLEQQREAALKHYGAAPA